MALINFNDIDFNKSIDTENIIIDFNGSQIEIVPYLSINDKYDLVMVTLQKSLEKGIYNPLKIDMYFALNVIYLYTNIVFNNEDRADEAALYDTLVNSGLVDEVFEVIPNEELVYLKDCIDSLVKTTLKYRNTFGAVVGAFINELPQNMEKAKDIIGEFDPEKYKSLLDLAAKLKGGSENLEN